MSPRFYRLKLFVEWCESVGIEKVGDLPRVGFSDYHDVRAGEVAPATLEGEMTTLRQFIQFLEQEGAVDEDEAIEQTRTSGVWLARFRLFDPDLDTILGRANEIHETLLKRPETSPESDLTASPG